jgi:hypothetical protein
LLSSKEADLSSVLLKKGRVELSYCKSWLSRDSTELSSVEVELSSCRVSCRVELLGAKVEPVRVDLVRGRV